MVNSTERRNAYHVAQKLKNDQKGCDTANS